MKQRKHNANNYVIIYSQAHKPSFAYGGEHGPAIGANASERLDNGVATLGSVASLGANASERLSCGVTTLGSVASMGQ